MRKNHARGLAVGAMALAILVGMPVAAIAAPATQPSAESVSEAAALPEPAPAALSVEEELFLEDKGIEGDVTVQEDPAGAVMYLDGEGDWLIQLPGTAGGEGEITPLWNAGVCAGSFYMPQKVGAYLEWGGQNSCGSTSPNGVYPHYLDVMLRDTCQGAGCLIVDNLWRERSVNSRYSAVATVSQSDFCAESGNRRYSLVAWPVLRGTQYGPFVSSSVDVNSCHVHPAPGGV